MSNSRTSAAWEETFHPAKPVTQKQIQCAHCKENSGYTNEDLIPLRGNFDLKCKQPHCGQTAIKVLAGAIPSPIPAERQKKRGGFAGFGTGKKRKAPAGYDVLEEMVSE